MTERVEPPKWRYFVMVVLAMVGFAVYQIIQATGIRDPLSKYHATSSQIRMALSVYHEQSGRFPNSSAELTESGLSSLILEDFVFMGEPSGLIAYLATAQGALPKGTRLAIGGPDVRVLKDDRPAMRLIYLADENGVRYEWLPDGEFQWRYGR